MIALSEAVKFLDPCPALTAAYLERQTAIDIAVRKMPRGTLRYMLESAEDTGLGKVKKLYPLTIENIRAEFRRLMERA